MRYNAFISYRHSELDMFVAKKVHKGLETFKVPHAVARKTGKKKINRVFRDQEELPIGSDLGDNIESALKESEFLIVICSPRTPESYWVQKEIATFIKMHGREHILAILVEGEPDESFPEILTVDEEGTPIEPLAADVRGRTKQEVSKKLKTEILRLAAPLLGCSYDDLRQRHRERFMKKVMAAAAGVTVLALAFGAYSAYNTMMIQKNYEGKQVNQSKYLADLSLSLLEEGDRRAAALIALEALPTEGNDRPYVASAQYALGESLGIYDTGNYAEMDYALKHDVPVSDISFSEDGTRLLTIDQANYIYVWDVENYTLLSKLSPEYDEGNHMISINEAALYADDSIIITDQNGIRSVKFDGTENWRAASDNYDSFALIDGNAGIAACVSTKVVTFYDLESGNELGRMENDLDASFASDMAFNEKHDKFVISHLGSLDAESGWISAYDFQTKQMTHYEITPSCTFELVFLPDDSFVLSGAMESVLYDINSDVSTGYVQKIDITNGETLWSNEYDFSLVDIDSTSTQLKTRSYTDAGTGTEHKEVLLSVNNSAYAWDAATGELITQMNVTNGIMKMLISTVNGVAYLVESSGTIDIVNMTNGTNYTTSAIETGKTVRDVLIRNGVIVIRAYASPDVTLMKYHEGYGKEQIEDFATSIKEVLYSENEEYYCVYTDEFAQSDAYHFYETEGNKKLGSWTPEKGDYTYTVAAQFVENTLVNVNSDGKINFYDVTNGQQESLHVTENMYGLDCYFTRNTGLCLITADKRYCIINLKEKKVTVSGELDTYINGAILSEDGQMMYVDAKENGICMVDTTTGVAKGLDVEDYRMGYSMNQANSMAVSEDGTLLAVNCIDNVLRVLDVEHMITVAEVPFSGSLRCFLQFSKDGSKLFMQGSDYYLRVYSLQDKEFLCIASDQNNEIENLIFDEDAGTVCVNTQSEMMLLEDENYDIIAVIENGLAYLPSYSRIYCKYNSSLYQFPYMTLEMLLEEAEKQFGDDILSDQERMRYNID